MPQTKEIEIFQIAKTKVDDTAVSKWLQAVGVDIEKFDWPGEVVSDPAFLVALAAKNCYRSFQVDPGLNPNVTRIRKDYAEYLDNVLASGHGSVLEHAVFSYAIQNCTRTFTAEMNRHRAGWAISECSLRFVRFGENLPYWEPLSIRGEDVDHEKVYKAIVAKLKSEAECGGTLKVFGDNTLERKKQLTREVFRQAFADQQEWYRVLEAIWKDELDPASPFKGKKEITSMMRRIVGMGVCTGGVWSGNVRALRHVLAMRCSPAAEEEIAHVFTRIADDIIKTEPMLFGDFNKDDGYYKPKYPKV